MKKKFIVIFQKSLTLTLVFGLFWLVPSLKSPTSLLDGQITTPAFAQEAKLTVRGSGLPVPRYVTLKFDEANLRAGPGREYPVLWQYRQAGLPLMVDAEFGIWRKVVDHDGTAGWMHGSVLSLRRMALVQTNMAKIYADPDEASDVIALAERLALMELQSCPKAWCRVASDDVRGWIKRQVVWGVLENESLD
ncbi:MAG: aspartyl-trna synthetase [Alphaproteobacteria bacterium]|jgi:SH3-like domain-containing protein|nr:aspartyl-trna synthetase [Paracoccaceae bacterium]NCW55718.1 aspartyl-trna synthetase [Paracoccaceae bacterium]NDA18488.1 aspartyl-trna synthetase [Alphaproteobacteria bacterium]NDG36764.1 aspartyl-trna synthetase [Alphaproteobacteria bacterium]HAE08772.1 aspartyl-trna synthetase [Alphaproteobacteria bacterium]